MGIINVTPDSFSDGRAGITPEQAIRQGQTLIEQGAHMLDIGGESSRPGAQPVSASEELSRIMPVIQGLRDVGVPLSVDTTKPEVMLEALAAGADMINDITAFETDAALNAVALHSCAVCAMHMQGKPRTMQQAPHYDDVVAEVHGFLLQRAQALVVAGVASERIVLDPGFGFGKTAAQNYELLRYHQNLVDQGWATLAGLSRKSMLGHIVGRQPYERVAASVAAALLAAQRGAAILRVHDVAATSDALRIWQATEYGMDS